MLVLSCAVGWCLVAAPSYAGGAANTCINWRGTGNNPLDGSPNSMTAQCKNKAGSYVTTTAWLPGCVGNSNGRLIWAKDGYFDRSCKNCRVMPVSVAPKPVYAMVCDCKMPSSIFWRLSTAISMDALSNWDGKLVCPV